MYLLCLNPKGNIVTRIAKTLQDATLSHQSGDLKKAETLYLMVLKTEPENFDATRLLGALYLATNRSKDAIPYLKRAVNLAPIVDECARHLGLAYHQTGEYRLAEKYYQQALQLNPHCLGTQLQLGDLYEQENRYDEAREAFQKACSQDDNNAVAFFRLGCVLQHQGQADDAIDYFEKVLALDKNHVASLVNCASLYNDKEEFQKAIDLNLRAIALTPDFMPPYCNLGKTYTQIGSLAKAEKSLEKALALQPDSPFVHTNLGNLHLEKQSLDQAEQAFKTALELDPLSFHARNGLGHMFIKKGQYNAAMKCFQAVLAQEPGHENAIINLANSFRWTLDFENAERLLERHQLLNPELRDVGACLLNFVSCRTSKSPETILKMHREYDARMKPTNLKRFQHKKTPKSKFRVGLVSPDLRKHSVACFLLSFLKHHKRFDFQVFCYAEVAKEDTMSAQIRDLVEGWQNTVALSNEELAKRIFSDKIDILIDLAGYTNDNRLPVFNYKPAPIQATYLGYYTGTGVDEIDYWITDFDATPEDTVEKTTETMWRLPRCCFSFEPPETQVPAKTATKSTPIVFGSFNALEKINPDVIRCWSKILQSAPGSRLLLKTKALGEEITKKKMADLFGQHGIPQSQLQFVGHTSSLHDHLSMYNALDIALDPFPMTGGTTTCEALFMGVPVITQAGDRYIERISTSILRAVGLDSCIANDEESYCQLAVHLAENHDARIELTDGLREKMLQSSLCDGADMAKTLNQAFQDMWERYISS
jgi:predicted O-linked N-acetylglucosamine transferase (SPINDLY family)